MRPYPEPTRWVLAAALSLPVIVLNCYWIANGEMKMGSTEVDTSSLFMGVTSLLFAITLLNAVVRRLAPDRALRQGEMLVMYIMISISTVVAGMGHYGFLLPFIANPFWFATPDNRWERFTSLIPRWLRIWDKNGLLKPFYEGHSSMFQDGMLRAWAPPLLLYGSFFFVLLGTMLCVAAILRRQWADHEHLAFPVVHLPFEMTRGSGELYRGRLLWIGFAIPLLSDSTVALNVLFPSIPSVSLGGGKALGDIITQRPWSGIDAMWCALHPSGVGLGYLVATDTLLSTWFFYLAFRALDVAGVAAGWRDPGQGLFGLGSPQFPFVRYQSWGAWIGLALLAFWPARRYLGEYLRSAWKGGLQSRNEAMSPRVAILGLVLGLAGMAGFGVWAGMSLPLSLGFLLVYGLLMLALSRIRAEIAVPATELIWVSPPEMLSKVIGTAALSHRELTGMALFGWFNTDYRGPGMPHEFEALQLGRRGGMSLKPIAVCILLAAAASIVAASLFDLQMYYVNGAGAARMNEWRISKGNIPWNDLDHWWDNPRPTDPLTVLGMAVGFGATLLLAALRSRWVGFPLHPAAYALNTSFAMEFFWIDFLVAWISKMLILRYGGMEGYRRAMPFFLGLILGDFVTQSAWSIAGALLGVPAL